MHFFRSLVLGVLIFCKLASAQSLPTTGNLKVLIIRVNFSDLSFDQASYSYRFMGGSSLTEAWLKYYWFEDYLQKFFNANSGGKLTLSGDAVTVDVPLRTDMSTPQNQCLLGEVRNMAIEAAKIKGFNEANYDKILFYYPSPDGCAFNYSYVPSKVVWFGTRNPLWSTPPLSVYAHEFSHSLGLDHNGAPFPSDPFWNQVSIFNQIDWDHSNVMGGTNVLSFFTSDQLSYLKWIDSSEEPIVTSGFKTIRCIENIQTPNGYPLAVRVLRNNGLGHYSINYRCPVSYDFYLPTYYFSGVTIYSDHKGYLDQAGNPDLNLDNAWKQIGGLADKQVFLDDKNNIEVIQINHRSDKATVLVRRRTSNIVGQFSSRLSKGKIRNPSTGLCLAADAESSSNPVKMSACGPGASQKWKSFLSQSSDGDVRIESLKYKGYCLTRQQDGSNNLKACDGSQYQQWRLEAAEYNANGVKLFYFENGNKKCFQPGPVAGQISNSSCKPDSSPIWKL